MHFGEDTSVALIYLADDKLADFLQGGSCPSWIAHGIGMFEQWTTVRICFASTKIANYKAHNFIQWHLATLNAWIRNEGVHKTKAKGFHNWSSELVEPVAKEMSGIWWSFDHAIEEATERCYTSLIALLEGVRENLKSMSPCLKSAQRKLTIKLNTAMPGIAIMPMNPFLKSLAPKKVKLQSIVEDFSGELLVVSK